MLARCETLARVARLPRPAARSTADWAASTAHRIPAASTVSCTFMPILQVIVLAVVQGFTEFLPISSTAHMRIASWAMGWQTESVDFDVTMHIGTLLAVLLYFGRDWVQIIAQGFGVRTGRDDEIRHNHVLLWLLAIGSVPAGIAGLLFQKKLEAAGDETMHLMIGGLMIAVGVVIWIAEAAARRVRDLASLSLPDALAIGLAQALAVIPGCSRSGITIGVGLFRGLTREAAARFSFLLSTPIIAAAAAKALYDMHKLPGGLHAFLGTNFFVGVAVSAVTGWMVIAWFLRYLRRSSLLPFVCYRIIFGIIVLALVFIRRPA